RESLRPGLRIEVAWYGDPGALSFNDLSALRKAEQAGSLVGVPADLERRGLRLGDIAPLDREHRADYKYLRPEAMGALLKLAAFYRATGGHTPLEVISLTQTTQTARMWRSRHPLPQPKLAPGETAEEDPEFHASGLVFDLARPASEWDR